MLALTIEVGDYPINFGSALGFMDRPSSIHSHCRYEFFPLADKLPLLGDVPRT
jgi:hypothetical protein